MSLTRQDIAQLKEALHAAELDGISFSQQSRPITIDGSPQNAEIYIHNCIRNTLRARIAAPIIAVLERHGWNGEY